MNNTLNCFDCQLPINPADNALYVTVDGELYRFHDFCVRHILAKQIVDEIARDVHYTILERQNRKVVS